ncbi:MAG: hypothetical protein FJ403_14195 [Verrucomicrobia bacterium]|nr:hypothetical protein [Verrucomicrobiota bacterium]
MSFIESFNPYQLAAGRDLDAHIHYHVLGNPPSHSIPNYSTDPSEADKLKQAIEAEYELTIEIGQSHVRHKPWFARYEVNEGNPTEVLAESYPLAICRLVILRATRS